MAETNGVWLDKDTGKIVKKQPARARQLVAPGSDLDDKQVKAIVERYEANVETATAPLDVERAVTSETVKPSARKK